MQIFKIMGKSEFHVLIKHCFLIGGDTVQAKQWLDKSYSDSAQSETMVKRWYSDFKYCYTDTNDAFCSGHPNSAVVMENSKKIPQTHFHNYDYKQPQFFRFFLIVELSFPYTLIRIKLHIILIINYSLNKYISQCSNTSIMQNIQF